MAKTSKSPKRVLMVAHAIGRRLPTYSHRFSPKKFTLPQLFACLVLKEFMRLDYRKLSAVLEDSPNWTAAIGLASVPHFSTFQKAARGVGLLKKRVARAAVDGTSFETRHIIAYYVKRCERSCKTGYQTTTYTRYPYANFVCDCRFHFVLGVVTGRGPGPDDPYFEPALRQTVGRTPVGTLLADAGFDSEHAHVFAREECGVRAIIPATRGRPTTNPLRGHYTNKMKQRFPKKQYGQRWQIETVNSMIKRTLGAALRARKYWSQSREIVLKGLTLYVMILWWR
jgi:hypothetical protein